MYDIFISRSLITDTDKFIELLKKSKSTAIILYKEGEDFLADIPEELRSKIIFIEQINDKVIFMTNGDQAVITTTNLDAIKEL